MEQKTKRLLLFLGAVFVAIIFVSSSASLGNNGTGPATTTTARQTQTFPVFGNSTGTITGYGQLAYLKLLSNSSATQSSVQRTLAKLQANGSINNYIGQNASYEIYLSGISAYSLQGLMQRATNSTSAVALTAATYVRLPANVVLYYFSVSGSVPINILMPARNFSFNMTNLKTQGSMVNVSIGALVTNNRSIYNNSIRVNLRR